MHLKNAKLDEELTIKKTFSKTKPEKRVAAGSKVDDTSVAPSTPPTKKRYICTHGNCATEAVYFNVIIIRYNFWKFLAILE